MAGYSCPTCGRTCKLPDYCCGNSMVQQGNYYCDSCKSHSSQSGNCCNSPMRQI